jgi:hypothetical protein
MRRYITILAILGLLNINISAKETNTIKEINATQEGNQTKPSKEKLIIDLDKEREEQETKGEIEDIIYGILRINENNDEVSFAGQILADTSDIVIFIKDSTDKIKKTIRNSLTIKTAGLKNGDKVIIKKGKNVLMDKEVERE